MIRIDGFGRSAAFAALAALAWMPWMATAGALLGSPVAAALHLVGATALYAGGLAPTAPRRAIVAALVALAGVVPWALASGPGELAIGLAVLLGVARSAVLRRTVAARTMAIEAALVIGGLWFARFLADGTALGAALAVWGFFLVQSCAFLVAGGGTAHEAGEADPFEEAHARATDVLDRPGRC